LRNAPHWKEWIGDLINLWKELTFQNQRFLNGNPPERRWQMMLSKREGGWGMRDPGIYQHTARMAAQTFDQEHLARQFKLRITHVRMNEEKVSVTMQQDAINETKEIDLDLEKLEKTNRDLIFSTIMQRSMIKAMDELKYHTGEFKKFTRNEDFEWDTSLKHKDLLRMIDRELSSKARTSYSNATEKKRACARFNSISVTGASTWTDAALNNFYGLALTDSEWLLAQSLYLGSPITTQDQVCKRCKGVADKWGYHALSCQSGKFNVLLHDRIVQVVERWLKKASFRTEREQRWNCGNYNEGKHNRRERPGDIKVFDWSTHPAQQKHAYFDIVCPNPMAPANIEGSARTRQHSNMKWEKRKRDKYDYIRAELFPLAIDKLGAIGPTFKKVMGIICDKLDVRGIGQRDILMNRFRKELSIEVMRTNIRSIKASHTM